MVPSSYKEKKVNTVNCKSTGNCERTSLFCIYWTYKLAEIDMQQTTVFVLVLTVFVAFVSCSCSSWNIATMTGYDNLDGTDDKHPGSLVDYTGTTKAFLEAVPVASILKSDWSNLKYHNITIRRKGVSRTVQSWDLCANEDCPHGEKDCCTNNAKKFGGNFLLDVERRTLKKLFNITNYDETLEKIEYQICEAFDPKPIAKKWNLK